MTLELPSGTLDLPAFFPDGTRGVVRGVDSRDLEGCGVRGIVMNVYHLMSNPGQSAIKALGGLHGFVNWTRPILTDSGGFQIFSLIRENAKFGTVQDNKIIFKPEKPGEKIILTPEKCIRAQFDYGSDIIMCLDYCTHPDDSAEITKKAVDITVKWAKRCKDEYDALISGSKKYAKTKKRPLIFGIIQGGNDKTLRKECAQALISAGFDGFGFGGWPLDSNNNLSYEILEYTAGLMPDHAVKYAMGLGRPEEIAACRKMGYNLFDCVIPTREARHRRLYVYNEEYESAGDIDLSDPGFYGYYYITDDKYRRDSRPVSGICECFCCRNYSRAYLRHLAIVGDTLADRLATIHNLNFYTALTRLLP